jgi:hypothetical protein
MLLPVDRHAVLTALRGPEHAVADADDAGDRAVVEQQSVTGPDLVRGDLISLR